MSSSGTINTVLKVLASGAAGALIYWVIKQTSIEDQQISQILQLERERMIREQNGGSNPNLGNVLHKRNRSLSSSQDQGNLIDLLQNTQIEYILGEDTHHVITIDSNATLDYALMRMNENNVTSLPIVDLAHKQYVGMLNIIDICNYLGQQPEITPNTSVSEVLKYNRGPFLPLFVNSPIQLLIHIMTQRVPQVAIMSSETIVVDIVSRLNVIKFIYENIEALGMKSSASISSLSLLSKAIYTVSSSSKVIDAINILNEHQIQEVAIVDEEGKLVGNFSATDLRKLSIYTFSRCYEPISKFIKLEEQQIDDGFIITPSSTLRSTMRKFVEHNSPILYIVDQQMKPVSSVTQLNLMKYFLTLSTSIINE